MVAPASNAGSTGPPKTCGLLSWRNAMVSEPPARLVELLDATFLFNELEGVQERDWRPSSVTYSAMTGDVNFVLDRITPQLSLFCGGSGAILQICSADRRLTGPSGLW